MNNETIWQLDVKKNKMSELKKNIVFRKQLMSKSEITAVDWNH